MRVPAPRRVVTGLNPQGRSCILFDGSGGFTHEHGGTSVTLLWQSDRPPVDNSGTADAAREAYSFAFAGGGTKFLLVEFEPGEDLVGPGMHATDTLDYGMLLSGRISLLVETGEVELCTGCLTGNPDWPLGRSISAISSLQGSTSWIAAHGTRH
jgi:hypothetical protein